MKKLSETYKELGIAFTFPIEIKDENGKQIYFENSDGFWYRYEYDENGNETYCERSDGYWYRYEYDENGNETYYEDSNAFSYSGGAITQTGTDTNLSGLNGISGGTKSSSCSGKVIEIDGKKYKLIEL